MAGELLRIVVGQQGVLSPQGNQANGGSGGGGGSFVWRQGEGQPRVAAGGGGGGGYSGGGVAVVSYHAGGGGGSYNAGEEPDASAGAREGHGQVVITAR